MFVFERGLLRGDIYLGVIFLEYSDVSTLPGDEITLIFKNDAFLIGAQLI